MKIDFAQNRTKLRPCDGACALFTRATAAALLAFAWLLPCGKPAAAQPVLAVTRESDGATVTVDGQLFARYLIQSGGRPAIWPLVGPTGRPVTRSYAAGPPGDGEETDHPHHRSAWFGMEGVNGCDFWAGPEPGVERFYAQGSIRHRDFLRADSDGRTAVIATVNDWLNPDGEAVCRDERLLEFGVSGENRWIDARIRIWSPKGPLKIADSKEGAYALRVASTMRVDAKLGGRIVSSRGLRDDKAWGQPAEWVDYQGPVDGATVGIAMMSHPASFRPTPRWHVRTYGLFSANPFGVKDFGGDPAVEPAGVELPEGESLRLRYLIYLHRGDEKQGRVAAAYQRFAESN
jgi:hypothetical protein